jgi:hypothetical protein
VVGSRPVAKEPNRAQVQNVLIGMSDNRVITDLHARPHKLFYHAVRQMLIMRRACVEREELIIRSRWHNDVKAAADICMTDIMISSLLQKFLGDRTRLGRILIQSDRPGDGFPISERPGVLRYYCASLTTLFGPIGRKTCGAICRGPRIFRRGSDPPRPISDQPKQQLNPIVGTRNACSYCSSPRRFNQAATFTPASPDRSLSRVV